MSNYDDMSTNDKILHCGFLVITSPVWLTFCVLGFPVYLIRSYITSKKCERKK